MIATQHSLVGRMRQAVTNDDWQRFYSLYEKPILAFAAARSLNEADSCDVLQETMVRMLRVGFARFDPTKGRFTGFLFNIARCCVIDAIRRRSRSEHRHVDLNATSPIRPLPAAEQLWDNSETPADAAERQGQMVMVLTTLDFLAAQRCFENRTLELFKAVTIHQKDAKETATAFRTSVGNVYQAKHAVLTKLRFMLAGLDQGLDLEQALVRSR